MRQKKISKPQQPESSATKGVSFHLRDVTISMERTSQPEGSKFTIVPTGDAKSALQDSVAAGQITTEENGTTLYLDWSEDVTVLAMGMRTGDCGHVNLAIASNTSKSAGAR